MVVLDWDGDRRRERGSFGDKFGASQWGRRRPVPKLLWGNWFVGWDLMALSA